VTGLNHQRDLLVEALHDFRQLADDGIEFFDARVNCGCVFEGQSGGSGLALERRGAGISEYREVVDSTTVNDYGGNTIAGFPDRIANVTVGFRKHGARAALTVSEVGHQYLDNSQDNRTNPALRTAPGYQRKVVLEHAVLNGLLSFELAGAGGFKPLDARRLLLEVRGMNLTGLRYETSGYVYAEVPYFYPAATRNFFVSLKAEF